MLASRLTLVAAVVVLSAKAASAEVVQLLCHNADPKAYYNRLVTVDYSALSGRMELLDKAGTFVGKDATISSVEIDDDKIVLHGDSGGLNPKTYTLNRHSGMLIVVGCLGNDCDRSGPHPCERYQHPTTKKF